MDDDTLYALAVRVGERLVSRNRMLVTAESCTGGWVGAAVTAVPGSSLWFERGFVTYTYISKREMLGVRPETLAAWGAVSEEAAREMAVGALARSRAQVALAVSGTAGPSGGTLDKPVGTVCFAWSLNDGTVFSETRRFPGGRREIRFQAVCHALEGVLKMLEN